MPADQPTTSRRPRPDPDFRSRALELPPSRTPVGRPSTDGRRETLRGSLAGISDIERSDAAPGSTAEPEPAGDPASASPSPAASAPASGSGAPADRDLWSDTGPTGGATAGPRTETDPQPSGEVPDTGRSVAPWRRLVFAVVVIALIGSIPVLAGAGYRLVTRSTDGKFAKSSLGPTDPGYEELVTSTPTAAIVQTDGEGKLVAVTILSLGSASGGGSVIFVPVDTLVPVPGFGIDRLNSPDDLPGSTVEERAALVSDNVAQILNVGLDETITLDADGWAKAVAPVAPFTIDSLDSLDIDGTRIPAGQVELTAEQVGPYLAAARPDEPQASRLARQQTVWEGWLDAVAASGADDAVPGETGSGLGLFARTLAKGDVRYATLPGQVVEDVPGGFRPDAAGIKELVSAAVPVPDPASPGSRRSVRLLNGVAAAGLPVELIQQVAALDASVTVVGNGPSFGRDQTSIIFADPANEAYANILAGALGATGPVSLERDAPDTIDVTVVLGRDVLGDATPSSNTAPTSVPPGGN